MTAEELLKRAAACETCGKEHHYRRIAPNQATWAAHDGHSYRPVIDTNIVAMLRYLKTGQYVNPWLTPKESLAGKLLHR